MSRPDLYPTSRTPSLAPETFQNPPKEYRGAPLWSWNCRLDREQLLKQIGDMDRMGLGGFHVHVRTGLDTPYLGPEFMEMVRACAEEAARREMRCYLYDEDRWPSGFAGGLVTQDDRYRAKHLLFTPTPYSGVTADAVNVSNSWANRTENGVFLTAYDVTLDKEGCLADYARIEEDAPRTEGSRRWYVYLETPSSIAWYNNQTYVDTLNPEAIRRFIEVTHEAYREAVGEHFGGLVPSIFTDEPQFTHKRNLAHPFEVRDLFVPFTSDLADTFRAAYGQDLLDHLPELFWELPGARPSLVRYRYHDHIAERFASAFSDQIGSWCDEHGLMLTGHMMEEPTLASQTRALGEAMRSYRAFHVPGIDMLCDAMELTTAKQAQSAARQYGRSGVMSELYGVTNWDFDFAGHKRQGDWQAALGVTLRVHHLTWVSMAGEAKRDYPASIGYHSPWYEEYPLVENHFARVNALLTRGQALCRVGVVHPVESYWLAFGPTSQTQAERDEREQNFQDLTRTLLHGLVDFDFLSESLCLDQQPAVEGRSLRVGAMAYEVVLVPGLRTIRSETLDVLEALADAGGAVIFVGEVPTLVDAQPSDRAVRLAARAERVPMSRARILQALEPWRELDARLPNGSRPDGLLHQLRTDGDTRTLFLCNPSRTLALNGLSLRLRGEWSVELLDTISGEVRAVSADLTGEWTEVKYDLSACGSLLLSLNPGKGTSLPPEPDMVWQEVRRLEPPREIELREPNVVVLDQARFRIDGGEWQGPEELLRIENIVRSHVGLPPSDGQIPQPWTDPSTRPTLAQVELAFEVVCETEHAHHVVALALEQPDRRRITWKGVDVDTSASSAHFVDESIRVVPLPLPLDDGGGVLSVELGFDRDTTIEWMYLLGDFGATAVGRSTVVDRYGVDRAWGDLTRMGLPFYAGNVVYRSEVEGDGQPLRLRVPRFRAPLIVVHLDGKRLGPIAFPPYEIDLGIVEGKQELTLEVFGSRVNAFGQLHNTDPNLRWFGPWSWRSTGDNWSYEYQLKPQGILSAPILLSPSSEGL